MALHPLNEYRYTNLGLDEDEDPDSPFAVGRVLKIPAPADAALMLPSADGFSVMNLTN